MSSSGPATERLDREDDSRLWALVDQVARIRASDPDQLELVTDLLGAIARQGERDARRRRGRPGSGSRSTDR